MNTDVLRSHRCAGVLMFLFASLGGPKEAFSKERYLIQFQSHFGFNEQIESLSRTALRVHDYIPEINVFVVEAPDEAEIQMLDTELNYREKSALWSIGAQKEPNDERLVEQKNYMRMNLKDAWSMSQGSREVVVAVIDTGIDPEHEDLKENLWENKDEIPDNGIDDDGNGYVDDTWGWNFAGANNAPIDGNRHGTHVAGTIGAVGDNGIGISGVNWNVTLMAVKFLSDRGSGATEIGIKSVIYAADNGADIINASWGGGPFSRAMQDALLYAQSKGTLVIAASGNAKSNTDLRPHYPSSYPIPNVISVAATAGYGVLSSFSNYGHYSVDVAAPGSDIYSTLPGSLYGRLSGTSMATPMVTGVAALILSKKSMTPIQLRNAVMNATRAYSNYGKKVSTKGEMNAGKALAQLSPNAGYQVWPSRHTLLVGADFQFTTYGDENDVPTWSSSNPKVASIDENGVLTALKAGVVRVSAHGRSGLVKTENISIVRQPKEDKGGGGGCFGRKSQSFTDSVSAAVSFSLPFLFGFLVRSRMRRRKKA